MSNGLSFLRLILFLTFALHATYFYVNVLTTQRFGSGSVPTHLIGAALLQGNWKLAVDMILDPRDGDILFVVSILCNG